MNRNENEGFTIVEVLAVTAIITLLTALLMPVIMKARETALMVYCMSNLQALGTSYHAYAIDYNDGIVPMIRSSSIYDPVTWYGELEDYGKDILGNEAYGTTKKFWIQCPKFKSTYNAVQRHL